MLVDMHNCEELMGNIFGSFYRKHLEMFSFCIRCNSLAIWSFKLQRTCFKFCFDGLNQFGLFMRFYFE